MQPPSITMKKHHYLLVLLLVGIAAYLLNETRNLKGGEAIVRDELKLLREAVKKSSGTSSKSTLAGRNNRPLAIDAKKFTVELNDFLKAGPSSAKGKGLDEFMTAYEPQLSSAPLAKLKEICELLEKNLPFDQPDTEGTQLVWFGVLKLAAKDLLTDAKLTPESHDLAVGSIAAVNIGPDTSAHAAWLLESLRSDNPRALRNFTDQWAHGDYIEAAKWMNAIPAGPKRDAAVSGFAPVASRIDGASAVDWALTLSDPAQRDSCLGEVVRNWKEMDPVAATSYLKEKGVIVK